MSRPVPIVYARGSHFEMGRQVGEDRREVIHRTLATYRELFQSEADRLHIHSWDEAILHARKYLPFAEESVPQYVEELRGVDEVAYVRFASVYRSFQDVTEFEDEIRRLQEISEASAGVLPMASIL